MPDTVDSIMNHEVYSVGPDEPVGEALGMILTLGITAAPVVDEAGVPLGLVSLRNLARAQREDPVARHMTSPAATITRTSTIEEAGREMGQLAYHHLVVVDDEGKVIGFVSSLDVVRGLVGLPTTHPPAFPHQEPGSGLAWTGALPLTAAQVERFAPAGPGMLVLTAAGAPDEVVWAEAAGHVRARLLEFVRGDHKLPELIADQLAAGDLEFKAAGFDRAGESGEGSSVIDVLLGEGSG
jgi:CBS domain-containing protein